MSIRYCVDVNNLQQMNRGRVAMKERGRKREIKVNLYFNSKGEPLEKIIERNLKGLNKRLS